MTSSYLEAYGCDLSAPLLIGAAGMDEIGQNIRMIIMTLRYSIPLMRGFSHDGKPIDYPALVTTSRLTYELVDAI